jgi:predicted nucleic acid-binding Zn ribbon protein
MERLGDEVRRSLRGAGVPDAGVLAAVTRAWPAAVGPGIAAAAWPARIGRDGTLHVHTATSVWAFELDRMQEQILPRLAEVMEGEQAPPRLRFAVGPVPAAAAPVAPVATETPAPSPEARLEADRIAASVEDAELRQLVRRAAAASLSRPAHDRPFW